MAKNSEQVEIRSLRKGLYVSATRFVRSARTSERQRSYVRYCLTVFPQSSPWRQAVELACRVQSVDVMSARDPG